MLVKETLCNKVNQNRLTSSKERGNEKYALPRLPNMMVYVLSIIFIDIYYLFRFRPFDKNNTWPHVNQNNVSQVLWDGDEVKCASFISVLFRTLPKLTLQN